jgi:signal transduction histidine kinase
MLMLLSNVPSRAAAAIRLAGLALIVFAVARSDHPPGTTGRGLVVSLLLAAAVAAWLVWMARPQGERVTLDLYAMAVAGGVLVEASSQGAASVFVFVSVVAAGTRVELVRAAPLVLVATLAIGVADLLYSGSALGLLAYALGFAACLLAASTARQRVARAEQAELLLAQTQRTHEEQLRAARLEESTRIAREIHDVLAHTLAGLTIQLEATTALLEQGAERDSVLSRVQRAHELAREGLRETRQAVGALRGDQVSAPAAIEALVSEYRAAADATAELGIDGDPARLSGAAGQAMVRVVQEALTNVRKHAPGADISVALHAGQADDDELVLVVADRATVPRPAHARGELAASGGGYGLQGMRERAQLLGGTLTAGPTDDGWRVELRLPPLEAREGRAVNGPPVAREEGR